MIQRAGCFWQQASLISFANFCVDIKVASVPPKPLSTITACAAPASRASSRSVSRGICVETKMNVFQRAVMVSSSGVSACAPAVVTAATKRAIHFFIGSPSLSYGGGGAAVLALKDEVAVVLVLR